MTIYYLSPVLIINGAISGIVNGSFIAFSLMFLSALFLGRAYCGWVCPGGGLGEACFMVTDKKADGGRLDWIKYYIWVPWVIAIAVLAIMAGGYHTIDPFFRTWHGISLHNPESYIVYFSIVALVAIPALTAGKRAFCHYLCWMAPFMVIGWRVQKWLHLPALHLEVDKGSCKGCQACADTCPMSLDVPEMVSAGSMDNSECILCGTCVDGCQQSVLRFAFRGDKCA